MAAATKAKTGCIRFGFFCEKVGCFDRKFLFYLSRGERFRDLRSSGSCSSIRLTGDLVGSDGRSLVYLWPFGL